MSKPARTLLFIGFVLFSSLAALSAMSAAVAGFRVFMVGSGAWPYAGSSSEPRLLTGCTIVLTNGPVTMHAALDDLAPEIRLRKPGSYKATEYTPTSGMRTRGRFRTSDGVRTGWVADDSWNIEQRSAAAS